MGLLRQWGGPLLTALAALAGVKLGYDAGLQMAGVWLGVIMAVNAGLFGGLLVSAVLDRLAPRSDRPPHRQGPG